MLDGRSGTNRGNPDACQVSAKNDLDAIRAWLSNYADRKATFDNYRKEAERLLLWCVTQLGKPLSSIAHEDLIVFKEFLKDPQPRDRWISLNGGKYPRDDARWRPFNGPLSPASQRQAQIILNGMFNWLVSAGYLRGNPMALSRQKRHHTKPGITRFLPVSLWDEVKQYIDQMPAESESERALQARNRWLTTLFYLQAMRISEVANGVMGDFHYRLDGDGQRQWWLLIHGKGEKDRDVPASVELVAEVTRYRLANGLPSLPSRSEVLPLLIPLKGRARNMSRSAVHNAIKAIFAAAATWLRSRGVEYADRADHLDQASAHWLRHTAGSHMTDSGVDLRTVRDNLGHESLNTTSLYLHTEDDARHRETTNKHKMGWAPDKAEEG
jgi:site-specific recombinase XerD